MAKSQLGELTPLYKFLAALFLVALALGSRASELAALDRSSLEIGADRSVSLLPLPGFLAKNHRLGHNPGPLTFPPLPEDPVLCPVQALTAYLALSPETKSGPVFLHPHSSRPLPAQSLSRWLVKAITWLLPNSTPKGHDTRKVAASLAWAAGRPLGEILARGTWSGSSVFFRKYLHTSPILRTTTNVVVLGSAASSAS